MNPAKIPSSNCAVSGTRLEPKSGSTIEGLTNLEQGLAELEARLGCISQRLAVFPDESRPSLGDQCDVRSRIERLQYYLACCNQHSIDIDKKLG